MKFKVSMKNPDALGDAINEAVKADVDKIEGLDDEEREAVIEARQETVGNLCSKWFEYGEYLVVEIDTGAATCTVVPVRA